MLATLAVLVFLFPQRSNELKLGGLPSPAFDIVTAIWLLTKGLHPRADAGARA